MVSGAYSRLLSGTADVLEMARTATMAVAELARMVLFMSRDCFLN